ncbi:MAG: cytochrome c oxidase assembly protein [Actinomycetota bacterium]|nr:cytochrome c oxidase assembly protein [Actinomycetota bacterium]
MSGWHPHLEVWALVIAAGVAYVVALRRVGPRHVSPGDAPASGGQKTAFFLGLGAVWAASDWPVHELSEQALFSVHMFQHLLLSLVAPPLLLMGIPGWMARALLPRPIMAVARRVTRPLLALILFNAVLVVTHWPVLVDASLRSEAVHFSVHAVLFVSALIMWTPVLSPIAELPRLHYPGQMLYLFLQSLLPTVPASFLTFGDSVIYRFYETVPRTLGLSALHDQQIAGIVMKLGGGFILWAAILVLFFKWHAQEEMPGVDALRWQDVEREINREEVHR